MDNRLFTEPELLELYEKIIGAMYIIDKDLPKLSEMHSSLNQKFDEASGNLIDIKSYMDKEVNEAKADVRKLQSAIQSDMKKSQKLHSNTEKLLAELKSEKNDLNKLEDRIEVLSKRVENLPNEERIAQNLEKTGTAIATDIDRIASIWRFQADYSNGRKGYFIVQKASWTGDFCFVVHKITENEDDYIAEGRTYKDGRLYRNKEQYSASKGEFLIYNGPSLEKIRKSYPEDTKWIINGEAR